MRNSPARARVGYNPGMEPGHAVEEIAERLGSRGFRGSRVALADEATAERLTAAAQRPWLLAALRMPVLLELDGGAPVYFRGRTPKGSFHLPHLREVAESIAG